MRIRGVVSGLLVLLACVVMLAVVPVRWLDGQLHTQAYADTIRPLPRDPAVQHAVVSLVSDAIESSGRPVPAEVTTTIERQAPVVLRMPKVTELWVAANLAARDTLLRGKGGEVAVDVDEVVRPLTDRLRGEGVAVPATLPKEYSRIVLADSPAIARAREVSDQVARLARLLPVVGGGLLLLALLTSPRRFRTLAAAGLGVGLPTLVGVLGLQLGVGQFLASVDDGTSRSLLAAVVRAFSGSLRSDLMRVLVLCAVVAAASVVLALVTSRIRRSRSAPGEDDESEHGYDDWPAGRVPPAFPESAVAYPDVPRAFPDAPTAYDDRAYDDRAYDDRAYDDPVPYSSGPDHGRRTAPQSYPEPEPYHDGPAYQGRRRQQRPAGPDNVPDQGRPPYQGRRRQPEGPPAQGWSPHEPSHQPAPRPPHQPPRREQSPPQEWSPHPDRRPRQDWPADQDRLAGQDPRAYRERARYSDPPPRSRSAGADWYPTDPPAGRPRGGRRRPPR